MDFHELKLMTVSELREVAKSTDGLTGYSQMHKEQLLRAICEALNIATHELHGAVGVDKVAIKDRIRELKGARAAALEARDPVALKRARRAIHHLKRKLRRATV